MGSQESDTTERLYFPFSLSCIGEGNGNTLQCSCLENPRDGKPGWLPSMRSHRVRHDWSDAAAAAENVLIWLSVYVCMCVCIYIYIYISECCYLYLLFKWHVFQIEHDYEIQVQHNHLQACICSTGLSSKNSFTTMCSSQKLIIIPTKKKKSFYLQC